MKFMDWLDEHEGASCCLVVFLWAVGLPGLFIGVGLLFGPTVGGLFLLGCVGAGVAVKMHYENGIARFEARQREEYFNWRDKQEPPTP